MSRIDEAIQAKKDKRQELENLGVVAHPYSFDKAQTIAEAREMMDQSVQTAGRIVALRAHGKVAFLDLKDTSATVQVMIREQEIGEEAFSIFKHVDSGDYLGVSGTVMLSKTNEVTILAKEYTFLGKALRPIPTAWNSAEDKEIRFRKRYLDILINPDTKRVLDARWLIEKELRRYLQDQHNFIEVETPVFQPLYGGTNAKPFSTHMNALDVDYYLRLAPELYLKRLVVAGYEKIFEIARNFRNEGIDQTHQPEFTMIEWYEAYADYNRMMDVAEGMFKHLAQKLYGDTKITVDTHEIDLGGKWPRITMVDSLKKYANIDFASLSDEELKQELATRKIDLIGEFTRGKAQFALFDKLVPEYLNDPIWIIDYPRDISPLAKAHRLDPNLAERFEAYIGGREIADGWSEITDAIDQRNIFENEQKRMRAGDSEAHPLDEDFLESMEYGMPPLGGIGIGIDRLVMFLTNTWSIREVIAFPTLRPVNQPKLTKTSAPVLQVKKESTVFSISPSITENYPSISVGVAIIRGVKIQKSLPELEQAKQAIVEQLKGLTTETFSEYPEVKSYRQLYKAMGIDWHSRRPSPEALLRRITQGKSLYTINTAVDAANVAVLKHSVSVGVFNLQELTAPTTLDIAQGGEEILLLGDSEPTVLKAGEIAYFDQAGAYNLDYNYRDSQRTMVTETTQDILINVDGAFDITEEQVVETLTTVIANIQKYCGGTVSDVSIISALAANNASSKTSSPTPTKSTGTTVLPSREQAQSLLNQYISTPALKHHSEMVAKAMEAYATELGEDPELWYQAGLLHDLDWEKYPDEHPNKAITEILVEYPQELKDAIAAHAPSRTGKQAETLIEKYLFACDELSGLMHAASLMRPTGFSDMEPKSIKKKLKDKGFAANVSREDITQGMEMIGKTPDEHISFLITVFK